MDDNGILVTLSDRIVGGFGDSSEYNNGTDYTLKFWRTVFSQPRIKSNIARDTFFGELDHPNAAYRDRETQLEKVSHRCNNFRFISNDGNLLAHIDDNGNWIEDDPSVDYEKVVGNMVSDVDVLDTPLGKILNTYVKAKANVGFSSRADGNSTTKKVGNSIKRIVDIATYKLMGIDCVINPSKVDSRILDESSSNSLESMLIDTINSVDEDSREVISNFITSGIGYDINSHIFDVCFGDEYVKIKKRDLLDIQNSLEEKSDDLYLDEYSEKVSLLIENILGRVKRNPQYDESTLAKSTSEDTSEELDELYDTIEEYEEANSKLVDENNQLKEKLENSVKYIVEKEFPNMNNKQKLVELVLESGCDIDYNNIRKIYNKLTFPSRTARNILVDTGNKDVSNDTSRLKNIILGRK